MEKKESHKIFYDDFIEIQLKISKDTANEISAKSIKVAKKRLYKTKNISYIVDDIVSLEVNKKFDVIALPDVLKHIPMNEHIILFNKLNKLLKKTEQIFILLPNPFYFDYLVKNTLEKLHELYQPLYKSYLSIVFENTVFFIQELNNYSIYIKENDYQYIILKSTVLKDTFVPISLKKENILTSILNKIKRIR
jgi:trans-aconitate 2-methyltransferase